MTSIQDKFMQQIYEAAFPIAAEIAEALETRQVPVITVQPVVYNVLEKTKSFTGIEYLDGQAEYALEFSPTEKIIVRTDPALDNDYTLHFQAYTVSVRRAHYDKYLWS